MSVQSSKTDIGFAFISLWPEARKFGRRRFSALEVRWAALVRRKCSILSEPAQEKPDSLEKLMSRYDDERGAHGMFI